MKRALVLFCIALPIFLLLLAYKITIITSDFTEAQKETLDYLKGKSEVPKNYGENEVSHLQDVKQVMKKVDYFFLVLLLGISLTITSYRKSRELRKLFLYGGISTISLMLMIVPVSIFAFNELFDLFHKIVFPQGNWMFPLGSLLITVFPVKFFFEISKKIFLQTMFLGSIFIVISYYLKNVFQNKRT
jgi:integral membrane protein (TIGR01906 family)